MYLQQPSFALNNMSFPPMGVDVMLPFYVALAGC